MSATSEAFLTELLKRTQEDVKRELHKEAIRRVQVQYTTKVAALLKNKAIDKDDVKAFGEFIDQHLLHQLLNPPAPEYEDSPRVRPARETPRSFVSENARCPTEPPSSGRC